MVRFCRCAKFRSLQAAPPFQSHLGSILPGRHPASHCFCPRVSIPPWFDFAARSALAPCATSIEFQSHLGSILPQSARPLSPRDPSFNPTLVRFCRSGRRSRRGVKYVFQSHLGSILPTHQHCPRACGWCFNPTLVRFCHAPEEVKTLVIARFNPTLVRFCRRTKMR